MKYIFYLVTATWVVIIGWGLYPIGPPITWLDGSVTPEVKMNGEFTVTREFIVNRSEQVTIIRTLVNGDCKKICEIVDLPTSIILLPPGEHLTRGRDFVLPKAVNEGTWKVVFVAQWRDRIGRTKTVPLKELSFNVIP